jgi:hypothetical protein
MAEQEPRNLRERPIGDLMRQLAQETSTLVRQELDLAKAEMTQKGKRAGVGIGQLGAAGVAGLYALGALTAAVIALLGMYIHVWIAALIVAIIYAAIAGVLALTGRKRLQEAVPPKPDQAIQSTKEDVQWAKNQMRSGGR